MRIDVARAFRSITTARLVETLGLAGSVALVGVALVLQAAERELALGLLALAMAVIALRTAAA